MHVRLFRIIRALRVVNRESREKLSVGYSRPAPEQSPQSQLSDSAVEETSRDLRQAACREMREAACPAWCDPSLQGP